MRILVDEISYPSKKAALKELFEAMVCTDGSECERMTFAYTSVMEGCTIIDTYNETAV